MYLSELKGYEGTDTDLGTSLYEYGLAWKFIKKENEYRFYYKVNVAEKANDCVFDWATVNADIDFWEEYDWVSKNDLLSFLGLTENEFNKLPLPVKISDLVSHSGFENVFGSCYNSFSITTNQY